MPEEARSTVLSQDEEAVVVAFRRHNLLPLDDCLYAIQPALPHLTRSSLHRCPQRHGIFPLLQVEDEVSAKRKFKAYPIGFFHIEIAEVRTELGSITCLLRSTARPKPSTSPVIDRVAWDMRQSLGQRGSSAPYGLGCSAA